MQIDEIKDQICDVCHKMWQLGWVAANDGNVSVRLDDGTFLATPTGMSKSFITPDKLLRIDASGNILGGAEGLRHYTVFCDCQRYKHAFFDTMILTVGTFLHSFWSISMDHDSND